YKNIKLKDFPKIIAKTLGTLTTIMILISVSSAFGWVVAYLKVPERILNAVMSITTNKVLILIMMNVLLLFLGMIMDMSSSIIITTPILLPIAQAIGMDPLQFGVMLILNLGIGLTTPPVGSCLFVTTGIVHKDMSYLIKAMVPFYWVMGIALVLITYVPAFSLFLPRLTGYA
ncbi:MAG: TRAP transporter large permease subunit, partial [Sphaerochaetaceae bacterium]|nr:TRAP transporter large permease subunit [Sphaerochaetaceae bacterium]